MSLESFGWDRYGRPTPDAPLCAARVVAVNGDTLTLATAHGMASAIVPGRLHYLADSPLDLPTVGDWVAYLPGDLCIVQQVLSRSTQLVRKGAGRCSGGQLLAANVDVVFIVTSANDEFSLRRLERYLTTVHAAGARAKVVVNKIDLPGSDQIVAQARTVAPDALALSATSGAQLRGFDAHLEPGATHVFVGSSGVGKSTLINHALATGAMHTNALRGDDTGQHTTTHRELLVTPSGAIVIDTPGLRELGVWESEGLHETFEDVAALLGRCRFRDCGHGSEPGCAIGEAIDQGHLDPDRWKAYGKLEREIQRQSGRVASWQERKKSRAFTKRVRRSTLEQKRRRQY